LRQLSQRITGLGERGRGNTVRIQAVADLRPVGRCSQRRSSIARPRAIEPVLTPSCEMSLVTPLVITQVRLMPSRFDQRAMPALVSLRVRHLLLRGILTRRGGQPL